MPVDVNSLREEKGGLLKPFLRSHTLRGLDTSIITDLVALDKKYRISLSAVNEKRAYRAALQKKVGAAMKASKGKKVLVNEAAVSKLREMGIELDKVNDKLKSQKDEIDSLLSKVANRIDEDPISFDKSKLNTVRKLSISSVDRILVDNGLNNFDVNATLTFYASSFFCSSSYAPFDLSTLPPPKKGAPKVDPSIIQTFSNKWISDKSLPSSHYFNTSSTLNLLTLTTNSLTQSRLHTAKQTADILNFLSSLNLDPTTLTLLFSNPSSLPLNSTMTTTILLKNVPLAVVTNSTDYTSRSLELRSGVRKMNQLDKNYCHTIESTINLSSLSSSLDLKSDSPLPFAIFLEVFNDHLRVNSYVKGNTPSRTDREALATLTGFLTKGDLGRWVNVRRWCNGVQSLRVGEGYC